MRAVFEEGTRRLVQAQQLRLREGAPAVAVPAGPSQTLALAVPTGDTRALVLEAVSQPDRRFDDWDLQVLTVASQLAAFVCEIERTRQAACAGPAPARDGAAPFIGSTPVMRALRQQVERGRRHRFHRPHRREIDPEPHRRLGHFVGGAGSARLPARVG